MGALTDIPLSRLSVARAGTATRVNSAGLIETVAANTARIDHRYDTGTGTWVTAGLLVEESRTNLLLRSAEFDNAAWGKTRLSIAPNATVAPDGTLSGDHLTEDTSVGLTHEVSQAVSAAGTNTFSVYLKAGARKRAQLVAYNATDGNMSPSVFDLQNGSVVAGSHASASIVPAGSGWYRSSITITCTATTLYFLRPDNGSTVYYTGDGVSGVYAWGAQLEAGAFPTSYIPTTTAAVTRNADVATMLLSAIQGWNPAAWSLLIEHEIVKTSPTTTGVIVGIGDGVNFTGSVYLSNNSGGSIGWTPNFTPRPAVAGIHRDAIAIGTDGVGRASANGGAVVSNSASTVQAAPTVLALGKAPWANGNFANGYIRRLQYFPRRLSNAELQALTA